MWLRLFYHSSGLQIHEAFEKNALTMLPDTTVPSVPPYWTLSEVIPLKSLKTPDIFFHLNL